MISDKPTANSEPEDSPNRDCLSCPWGPWGWSMATSAPVRSYAIRECFHGQHAIALNPMNILGVLSLVFWSLTMVVTVKYVGFILKADNRGEGGIFALLALLLQARDKMSARSYGVAVLAAVFGAALLYGDGLITPAISVLSAIEGLEVATKASKPFIIPLTCLILFLFFLVQRRGTADIGRFFGPIMILWFLTIGSFRAVRHCREPAGGVVFKPLAGRGIFPGQSSARHGGPGFGGAVHHRRGGPLRRHGPFQPPGHQTLLAGAGLPGPAAQLFRPGGPAAFPPGRILSSFLWSGPQAAALPGRDAFDHRHHHCLPGDDLRGLFPHPAGHPAWAICPGCGYSTPRPGIGARYIFPESTGS